MSLPRHGWVPVLATGCLAAIALLRSPVSPGAFGQSPPIEDLGDERVLSLCGTILNRQKLVRCSACDAIIGPAKYLHYIDERFKKAGQVASEQIYCRKCAREKGSQINVPVSNI